MKFAAQKNHLGGLIVYRSPDPPKNGVIGKKILEKSGFKKKEN